MNDKKVPQKSPRSGPESGEEPTGLTKEERAAIKERALELKTKKRRSSRAGKAAGEKDMLEKIAEMSPADRAMAERLYEIVKVHAPELSPRTWYGMPAFAKDGKVLCFFQSADKFKSRYATLGFNDDARLDDGAMWPTAYALTELTTSEEERIAALLKRAVG